MEVSNEEPKRPVKIKHETNFSKVTKRSLEDVIKKDEKARDDKKQKIKINFISNCSLALEKSIENFKETKKNPNTKPNNPPRNWTKSFEEKGKALEKLSRKEKKKFKRNFARKENKKHAENLESGVTQAKKYWSNISAKNERAADRFHLKVIELKKNIDWSKKENRVSVKKLRQQEAILRTKKSVFEERSKHPKSWKEKKKFHKSLRNVS